MTTSTIAVGRQGGSGWARRHVLPALGELLLIGVTFQLYRWARLITADDVSAAFDNAASVLRLQELLGLPSELAVQGWALGSDTLVRAANGYYLNMHFPVAIALLLWLFVRHRDDYRWVRGALVLTTGMALAVHLLVPLAPPRMLPGFVDTGLLHGQSAYSGSLGEAANQIAAMPSLHVGWAVAVAVAVIAVLRSPWRWLAVLHPLLTIAVVVVTANHYWVDGGAAVLLLTLSLAVLAPRPLHRLPWLASRRDEPTPGPVAARAARRLHPSRRSDLCTANG